MILTGGGTEVLGQNRVAMSLYPSLIPKELPWESEEIYREVGVLLLRFEL